MADINTQELQRALAAVTRQTSSLTGNLRQVNDVIGEISRNMDITNADYKTHINELRSNLQTENTIRKQDVEESKRLLETNKRLNDIRARELSALRDQSAQLKKEYAKQSKLAAEYSKKYGVTDDLTAEAFDRAKELNEQIEEIKNTISKLDVAQKKNVYATNRHADVLNAATDTLNIQEFNQRITTTFKNALSNGFKQIFPVVTLADLVKQMYGQIRMEIATGFRVAGTPGEYGRVASLGTNATAIAGLAADNRRAIVAAGGTEGMFQFMEATKKAYEQFIPLGDQAAFAAQQMTILTNAGIAPTAKAASSMVREFDRLQRVTGVTGEQFNAMMLDVVNSQEYQSQLRLTATTKEREAMLAGTRARIAENVSIGMMTEQAIKAEKVLAKIGTERATTRYQTAAQYQALMAAMNVQGGSDVARILRLNQSQRTEEDRNFLNRKLIELANTVDKGVARGGGSEFAIQSLIEKLDPTGQVAEFSTTGKEVAKVTDKNIAAMEKLSDSTTKLYQAIEGLRSQMMNNPYVQGVGIATGATIGALSAPAAGTLWNMAKQKMGFPTNTTVSGSPTSTNVPPSPQNSNSTRNWARAGRWMGGAGTAIYAGSQMLDGNYGGAVGGLAGGALGTAIGGALGMGVMSAITAPLGAMLGSAIGSYVGESMTSKKRTSVVDGYDETKAVTSEREKRKDDYEVQSIQTATNQLTKLNEQTDYLKNMATATPRMVELLERQLAIQMSAEQNNIATLARIRGDKITTSSYKKLS